MNWFDTSGLTSLAKTALKEAQKTIDKALDIQDESSDEQEEASTSAAKPKSSSEEDKTQKDSSDFFSSWGLSVSGESSKELIQEQPVVTESPTKGNSQSMWGSFAGNFFEPQTHSESSAIIKPPKAKSLNLISDKYGSNDDLFSKSQLVMSDCADTTFDIKEKGKEDRRGSTRSHRLSLVSSRNSSDSVEVLSQSLKTTPDSEAASALSVSHSSSLGQKLNSESVEILPDSLVSPSSIECLGFDSYSSDKEKSVSSSSGTPGNFSDKVGTPVGDKTEKGDTADSVSLVVDDDEDTMSYNSISECTAPTVLDTEDKPLSLFQKPRDPLKKCFEKELLEPVLIPQKMQISGNSSNDGSWSDRTLNADNDSIILENMTEETKKEVEQEDIMMEKLSDSSSFYDIKMSSEMLRSESSTFVTVEKQQCNAMESSKSSEKDSIKERVSPVSSDSKSDLVKIGSDRTSGHTSGDELETATSSDIEIIPSPNGENSGYRHTPVKYVKPSTSPNLVDLVLGKSLATKIRGHNRELSEASVQSNTSDESQGCENERLMKRLCEMAEILEARENRLMEMSRTNAELTEMNADLKTQVDSLTSSQSGGDINVITEDYTQRMSALEKKFQQAIREKDQLRKQLEVTKCESTRKLSSEFENSLKDKDEVISQLQEEGEKLARQQLQHSNIIKKLRVKEKDNEQVIKGLRDKISELTAELDRVRRSMAAKEELEVNQIEAVYRLTNANKKMELELIETRNILDDTVQRLGTSQLSLEAARTELTSCQRELSDVSRRKADSDSCRQELVACERERDRLREQLQRLRLDMVQEEKRWLSREESLRRELNASLAASVEGGGMSVVGGESGLGGGESAGALLAQLAALQHQCLERDRAIQNHNKLRLEWERQSQAASERLQAARSDADAIRSSHDTMQRDMQLVLYQKEQLADECRQLQDQLDSKSQELDQLRLNYDTKIAELTQRITDLDASLATEKTALDTEKKRTALLQEQLTSREVSPPPSEMSDSVSATLWSHEESTSRYSDETESLLAELRRRQGEVRGLERAKEQVCRERTVLQHTVARLQASLDTAQLVQEQYDALLQMYGEKEEQLSEVRLDLGDVTQLYKQQLDEIIALKQQLHKR